MRIGEIDGSITERVQQLKTQLDHIITTEISNNIIGLLWSKLCWNAAVSGLGAVLGETFGETCETEVGRDLLLRGYKEVMDTARAHGVQLVEVVVGYVTPLYLPDDADATLRLEKHNLLIEMTDTYAAVRPSMLQSLERGRKTEIEYLNGHVVRKAKEKGIPVPLNEIIVSMIEEIETRGASVSGRHNRAEILTQLGQ